jgi:hypothetical protein
LGFAFLFGSTGWLRISNPFFEGGLDLKKDSNDSPLVATMVLWINIMIITLMG